MHEQNLQQVTLYWDGHWRHAIQIVKLMQLLWCIYLTFIIYVKDFKKESYYFQDILFQRATKA